MNLLLRSMLSCFLMSTVLAAPGQINPEDVINWNGISADDFGDGRIDVAVRLITERDFTLYADKVTFHPPAGIIIEETLAPPTKKQLDPISKKEVEVYSGGDFLLKMKSFDAKSFGHDFAFEVNYIGCTQVICLFPHTQTIRVNVYPRAADLSVAANADTQLKQSTSQENPEGESAGFEAGLAKKIQSGELSFALILLLAALGGLLTNLTPCVAPMIPITVRVLGKQTAKPFLASCAYSGGLVLSYTGLGLVAASSASLFGGFMGRPAVAIAFAILMFIFGLSMIGFGNLSGLQNWGAKIGHRKNGLINAGLLGVSAGFVAAPCTGPVLAAILTYASSHHAPRESALILFCYSLGFGLPYLFLGHAAARLGKVKVSPWLQIFTKVCFASIMMGLGFYYLRLPFFEILAALKPHLLLLSLVFSSAGTLLVFLAVKHLQRSASKFFPALASLVLGFGIFCTSQVLTQPSQSPLAWIHGEANIYQTAQEQQKPILIDAWAEWCEACKKMEVTTFRDSPLTQELQAKWIVGKIDFTEQNEATEMLQKKFAIQGLPTLILLPPDGDLAKKQLIAGMVDPTTLLLKLREFEKSLSSK